MTVQDTSAKSTNGGNATNKGQLVEKRNFLTKKRMNSFQKQKAVGVKGSLKRKNLSVGDICEFNITGLGLKGIGIDEYTYGHSVMVPNTKLGDKVKAKVLKVSNFNSSKKLPKYAIAKVIESQRSLTFAVKSVEEKTPKAVNPGDQIDVKITKVTSKGGAIAQVGSSNFPLILPNASSKLGSTVKVIVTLVKENYAFAKEVVWESSTKGEGQRPLTLTKASSFYEKKETPLIYKGKEIKEGSKVSFVIPQKAKKYGKYFIVKFFKNTVLFLKRNYGSKPGDKVRFQITKSKNSYLIGEILQINPVSKSQKLALVRTSLQQMVQNGMHFGEKAVKCNSRMKNYIWLKKQGVDGKKENRPFLQKGRHIINLFKTRRCLNKALNVVSKYALKGRTFLFIGTKKPAAGLIARASLFSKTSFYVNTRWLGGMLTNWQTIRKSIQKIQPILKEKQKIIRDILEKRQNLKYRLIKKALLLKKKSKFLLKKGQQFLAIFKNPTTKSQFIENAKKLSFKRKELFNSNLTLLEKRQMLLEKRRELMVQSKVLKEKGLSLSTRYQSLLTQLVAYTQKLREYKYLLMISKEIQSIKANAKKQSTNVYLVSYNKLKDFNTNSILPNPPKDILNKMVSTIMAQQQASSQQSLTFASNTNPISPKSTTEQKNVLVLSKLFSQFSRFLPYIQNQIQSIQKTLQTLQTLCNACFLQFKQIQTTLTNFVNLKTKLVTELQAIKAKLSNERNVIRIVKKKLKHFAAQKRLMKLLSRFKYLPTPQKKISETVQVLMKKIVDPKLKYPIDQIYNQKLSTSSKKVATARKKKWQRFEKYFGGIANMTKLNKANILQNVAIIIGQKEEMNAVRECQKLGIKMFNIVDTNCNPTFADHIIPANDDSRNSIKYILQKFLIRMRLAQKIRRKLELLSLSV
jgi:small subunit ribosomal protein S2